MSSDVIKKDTIAAIATPAGRGGVGIVRISGSRVLEIAKKILFKVPEARMATYLDFLDADHSVIDQGIALFFPGPNSFTGEDVLELQGHGGSVVMQMLLDRVVQLGARLAQPGEFSERAFLNNKIDLAQAEAIADLIDSATQQAAKGAIRSLQGEFSRRIHDLDEQVVNLRIYVEAALDFPEEEIDFLADKKIQQTVNTLHDGLSGVLQKARQGTLLKEGITLVLAGRPNAGKSSLMNELSGRDSSIVTTVEGTTRDLVSESIQLDGIPLNLVDTAGIRVARDEVEREGVRRALNEMHSADGLLLLIDLVACGDWRSDVNALIADLPPNDSAIVVLNKVDLLDDLPIVPSDFHYPVVFISAKFGTGVDELKSAIKQTLAIELSEEGSFIARSRHVDALTRAQHHLEKSSTELTSGVAGELVAEELRLCHEMLCEITGEFSSDDLLGRIFSSFCIGK